MLSGHEKLFTLNKFRSLTGSNLVLNYLIGHGVDLRGGVHDVQLVALSVGLHDSGQVVLVVAGRLGDHPHHGLTGPCYGRLAGGVDP